MDTETGWTKQNAGKDLVGQALALWNHIASMFPTRVPEVNRIRRVQAKAYERALRRIRKAA
jgi:hypothetical protein